MAEPVAPSADQVLEGARALRASAAALRGLPAKRLVETLGAVGERFLDPDDALRTEALERLPESAAISPPMAKAVLDGMAAEWTPDRLREAVIADFGSTAPLDGFVEGAHGSRRALGGALTVQIVSGSVPGVGVTALLRSLLVKSPTLLKTGAGDTLLPMLFERGLREVDPSLAASLAVRYWPGSSDGGRTEAAVRHAEVVVVYGANDTIRTVRSRAPVTARVVEYRHREGLAIVARDQLGRGAGGAGDRADDDAMRIASQLAHAISIFDQRGCVCPHLVLVEEGGATTPDDFARLLADGLARLSTELPSVGDDVDERAALQQLRGVMEMQAAAHGGFVLAGAPERWTVVFEPRAIEGPPMLGRSVRVRPVTDLDRLDSELEARSPHLQSVGLAAPEARWSGIADTVGRLGASRVVPIDRLAFPPAWWLHDGRGPLRELVRWVEVEVG